MWYLKVIENSGALVTSGNDKIYDKKMLGIRFKVTGDSKESTGETESCGVRLTRRSDDRRR